LLNANFGISDANDGRSDARMLLNAKNSIRDNGLEVPLMIEWGVSEKYNNNNIL
jgi:hypothetical protein